jgi:methionine aminopeptidase
MAVESPLLYHLIDELSENKAIGIMKPGHCFTIEPMINEGVWRDNLWPDDWTAVTAVCTLISSICC